MKKSQIDLKKTIPFNVSIEDDVFYKKIKSILSSTLTPDSFKDSELTLPIYDERWTEFHIAIVNKILITHNRYMWMWSSTAWFHGYFHAGEHACFKIFFQVLNLAIKAIYHHSRPRSPDQKILTGIDQLLLVHINKMRISKLFKRELEGLYADFVPSLCTNLIITTSPEHQYAFQINEEYVESFAIKMNLELTNENKKLTDKLRASDSRYEKIEKSYGQLRKDMNFILEQLKIKDIIQDFEPQESSCLDTEHHDMN